MGVSAATETGSKTYPVNGSFTYNTTAGSQTIQQLASIMHMSFEKATLPNGLAWSYATNWQITKVSGSSGVSFSTTGNQYNSNLIFTYSRTSNTTLTWTGYVTAEYNGTTYKANISLKITPYLSNNDISFATPTVTKQLTGTSMTYTQTATSSSTATKTYSISPTTGTSINSSTGAVTITKAGTYTITCSQPAKWNQANSYDAGSATYTLVVTSVPVIQEYYGYSTSNFNRWLKATEVLSAAGQSTSTNLKSQKVESISVDGSTTTVTPIEYSSSQQGYSQISDIIASMSGATPSNFFTSMASASLSSSGVYIYYPSKSTMGGAAYTYKWIGFGIQHPANQLKEYAIQVYVSSNSDGSTPYRCLYVSSPDPAKVNAIKMKNGSGAMSNGVCNFSIPSLRTDAVTGTTVYSVLSATGIDGNPLVEGTDYTINTSTGAIVANKPGTFSVQTDFKGNTSTGYFPAIASSTFTITKGTGAFYHKTMSCVMNEINLTHPDFDYPGYQTMDENWAANSRKLRYVNTNRAYNELPQNYLNEHTVIKNNDILFFESEQLVINGDNKVVSSHPTFCDDDKYDYVVPNKAGGAPFYFIPVTSLSKAASAPKKAPITPDIDIDDPTITNNAYERSVRYSRSASLIAAPGHYSTICLPFEVPEAYMPEGFTFEEHILGSNPEKTDNPTLFNFAFYEVTYLEAGKPYIFKRNEGWDAAALEIEVPAERTHFVAEPSYEDPYFYGTFINLIEKDLHAETSPNPYNNGASVCFTELDTYFTNMYDKSNKRVAYFIKQSGSNDEIRRAASNVTMRPLRSYFRFNEDDDLRALNATGQAKLMVVHFSLDDFATGIRTQEAEGDGYVDVYTPSGSLVAKHQKVSKALEGLRSGIYILSNGKKVMK